MTIRQRLTVLFDLDGTLIDSIDLIVSAGRHAFATRPGPAPTDEQFLAGIGQPLTTQFGPYAIDVADMELLVSAYRVYQLEHHDRLTKLYDGVLDAVLALKNAGHVLGIVTSKAEWIAQRSLTHVGLDGYFHLLVGVDATQRHKPDPEPVRFALERLGGHPDRSAFIGDSPYDIRAGNGAGVATAAATWGAFPRDTLLAEHPSYVLERPQDIPSFIETLGQRGPA